MSFFRIGKRTTLFFEKLLEILVALLRQRDTCVLCWRWSVSRRRLTTTKTRSPTISRCDYLWILRARATWGARWFIPGKLMLVSTMEKETTAWFRSLLLSVSVGNQTASTALRTPVVGHGVIVEITHFPPVSWSIEMVLPTTIGKRFRVICDPFESSLTVDIFRSITLFPIK